MRYPPALLLIASLALISCAEPRRADLDGQLDRIDAMVQRAFEVGNAAGLGVGVAVDGRIEYQAALGMADVEANIPVNEDTYWYVASTSKSLVGFGVALLDGAGEVDIDAPITRYLPDVQWPEGIDPADLTVADFLGHTHGMGNGPLVISAAFTGVFPESEYDRLIRYNEVRSRELEYSNLGYNVAGMVIDAVRPEGWKAFLREQVYGPAGLSELHARVSGLDDRRIAKPHDVRADGSFRTRPFWKRDITMNAAGGHLATIQDLTRWAIVQMDGGRIDGRQVFPEEVVRRGQETLRTRDQQFAFFQRDGWAAGWNVGSYRDEPMVSRFGSYMNFRSHLSFLPAQRVGVVAQMNGPTGGIVTDIIAAYVYDVMMDRPDADSLADARLAELRERTEEIPSRVAQFEEVVRSRQRPFSRPLSDFAGSYENEAFGRITFTQVRDTLRMSWGVLEGPTTVYSAEGNLVRSSLLGSGSVKEFLFEDDGPATAVRFFSSRFERVSDG